MEQMSVMTERFTDSNTDSLNSRREKFGRDHKQKTDPNKISVITKRFTDSNTDSLNARGAPFGHDYEDSLTLTPTW